MFGLFTRKEKKSLFQSVRQNELWFTSDGSQSGSIGHPLADIELPIQLNQLTTIRMVSLDLTGNFCSNP